MQAVAGSSGNTPIVENIPEVVSYTAGTYADTFKNGVAGINIPDLEEIESYLNHKFNIELAVGHPYKDQMKRKKAII